MRFSSHTDTRTPVYYLPIWFQAIKGNSAVESGIHTLPLMIALVVASILTGILTSRMGYYMPFLLFGICVTSIGAGLLTILKVNTSTGQWIGYQILYGFGFGASAQAPNMAAQTVLPRNEVSIGISLMLFSQTLFGSIFVSVGQNVLDKQLANRLSSITNITSQQIQTAGVTGLLNDIPPKYHPAILEAYNASLRVCFQIALIMACISILGAIFMEWRNVRSNLNKNPGGTQTAQNSNGQDDSNEKKESEAVDDDGKDNTSPA